MIVPAMEKIVVNTAVLDPHLYAAELLRVYSPERMTRYGAGNCREMVINHPWNIELCESLYPTLCGVELLLRNTIDHALTSYAGRADYYDTIDLQRDELRAAVAI